MEKEIVMKKVQLFFDEPTHTYTDDEGNIYTSATTLIGQVEPDYDVEFWSMYRALDRYGHQLRPDLENRLIYVGGESYTLEQLYRGVLPLNKTPNTIKAEWKQEGEEACDHGNKKHNFLEDCINALYRKGKSVSDFWKQKLRDGILEGYRYKILDEKELEESPLKAVHPNIYNLLVKYLNAGYVLYAEKRVYSYYHLVSGTIDVLAVRKLKDDGTIHFVIIDWKTNKAKLEFRPGYYKKAWNSDRTKKEKTSEWVSNEDKFLFPLNHISYCKGYIYTLQLSLYAYLCELWGMKCDNLILCHFPHKKDENGIRVELKPVMYKIEYLKDDIKTLLNWHYTKNILKKPVRRSRKAVI